MKIKTRSRRQELITLILVAIALLTGTVLFFIAPTIKRVKSNYVEFYKEKTEIERLLTEGSTEELLERQARDLRDELDELDNGFITKGREVEFITFLEGLGELYNLKQMIQLNEPEVNSQTDFFRSALLTLKIEGDFLDLLGYLTELERSPYYVNVSSITIVKDGSSAVFANGARSLSRVVPEKENNDENVALVFGEALSMSITGEVFWQHEQ